MAESPSTTPTVDLREQIVEHIAEGVHLTRACDGTIVFTNPAFDRLFGYAPGELVGQHVSSLNAATDRDPAETAQEIIGVVGRTGAWRGEICNRRKDGSSFWCHAVVSAFDHPEFGPVWLSIHEDITDAKRFASELRQATDRAEAANRAKTAFLARMSHELRTPLNAVLGALDLLAAEGIAAAESDLIRVVRQGATNLHGLVEQILDLSAIESGLLAPEPSDVELRPWFQALLGPLALLAKRKGLDLKTDVAGSVPPRVRLDAQRLGQVATNLVGNAIKFTEIGHIHAQLAAPEPGQLRLAVTDTGPGIDAAFREFLFDPYRSRSRLAASAQGSGLGLAIAKGFVELMGGTLDVASGPQGAVFTVNVPHAPALGCELPTQPTLERPATGLRVLVAEDDPVSAMLIVRMLHRLGAAEVAVAKDGAEALERAGSGEFHVLLVDRHMPRLDGLAVVQAVRAKEAATGQAPAHIGAVTADAFAGDRQACLDAGCDAFLAKPLQLERLAAFLGDLPGEGRRGAESKLACPS